MMSLYPAPGTGPTVGSPADRALHITEINDARTHAFVLGHHSSSLAASRDYRDPVPAQTSVEYVIVGPVLLKKTWNEVLAPGARLATGALMYGLPAGSSALVAPDALAQVPFVRLSRIKDMGPLIVAMPVLVSVMI